MLKIFKTFYKFITRKKFWLVIFWILLIVSPIVSSLTPYFYKLFVDNIPTLDISVLTRILILFIAVKFAQVFAETACFFVGDILTIDGVKEAQQTVFAHIHLLDFAFHTKKSSGSLISAIKRGEGAFWNLFFSFHYRIIDVLVRFAVMLYFFANIDQRILWFGVASFFLGIGVSVAFVRFNIKFRREVNEKEDKISAVVVDNMINFETVKLFAKESWEQKRYRERLEDWKGSAWKYVMTFRGLDIGMGTVVNVSTFIILLYALKLAITKEITIGDFVLVATFIQSFFNQLFELVWGLRDIAKSYSDVERFFGILENEIEIKDPENPVTLKNVKGEIKYKNVTFSYEKNTQNAVKNITLTIRQGQSIALVGRSGSGKTTLAKLLLRFFDVDSGKITIDGIDIKTMTKDGLRSLFGVVPQEPVLFNNTVGYNISYGKPGASQKEVIAAAKIANIHKFIRSLPEKYETQVGERGIKLSGGQKQRLAIARTILSDPQIIIFDEATSQLDSESEKLIQDAFWKASAGKTTIIIAHRLSTIQKADKIIVMEKGRIIEEGSHKSLIEKEESLYNHFWNLQIKLK
jgi:ABC-type multidrug transport system fused ATPase/permease subunit